MNVTLMRRKDAVPCQYRAFGRRKEDLELVLFSQISDRRQGSSRTKRKRRLDWTPIGSVTHKAGEHRADQGTKLGSRHHRFHHSFVPCFLPILSSLSVNLSVRIQCTPSRAVPCKSRSFSLLLLVSGTHAYDWLDSTCSPSVAHAAVNIPPSPTTTSDHGLGKLAGGLH